MRRVFKSSRVVLAAVALVVVGSVWAMARSGSRNDPPSGSGQRAQQQAPLALEGYCPVSILEMRKWVVGDPAHQVVYDGRTYRIANEQGKRMFQANPTKYVPALGGNCPVCRVNMGQNVPGKPEITAFHKGLRYLFPAVDQRQAFLANPEKYVSPTGGGTKPNSGSPTRPPAGSGSGMR